MIFVYGNEHFNPLIPRREIHPLVVLSSHPWRNFNPLIPRREIPVFPSTKTSSCISIHSSHEGRYSNTAQKSDVIFLQYYQKLICFPYLLPQKLSKFPELAEKATCIPVRIPHTFYVSFWFAPEFRIIRSFESSQHLPESDPHESQKRNPGIF